MQENIKMAKISEKLKNRLKEIKQQREKEVYFINKGVKCKGEGTTYDEFGNPYRRKCRANDLFLSRESSTGLACANCMGEH